MRVVNINDHTKIYGGKPTATTLDSTVGSFVSNFVKETGAIIYHTVFDNTPTPPPVTLNSSYRDFHDYARDGMNVSANQVVIFPSWYGVKS
ncbi:MAG: hypothetical protein V4490_02900 [Pseudomonadota bacterium]